LIFRQSEQPAMIVAAHETADGRRALTNITIGNGESNLENRRNGKKKKADTSVSAWAQATPPEKEKEEKGLQSRRSQNRK